MGIGPDANESKLNPDLYDKSEYEHLEDVANWALQELRGSDDPEIVSTANDVMHQTKDYLESEYDQTGFSLDLDSSVNGDKAYESIRREQRGKAQGDFETWNSLEGIRCDLKKLLELKGDY